MKKLLGIAVICLVLLITLSINFRSTAQPQQSGDAASSQVLIQEIRGLRRALEDFTTKNSRVQVMIERVRLQQTVVQRLNDEIDNIQVQINANEDLTVQLEETIKNLEHSLEAEEDTPHKEEISRDLKSANKNVELYKQRNVKLEERKTQVNASLQTESARLAEMQQSLETLSRPNTAQQSK